jgi:hypothetical protein
VGEPHKRRQARAVVPALHPGYVIRVDEQTVAQLMLRQTRSLSRLGAIAAHLFAQLYAVNAQSSHPLT